MSVHEEDEGLHWAGEVDDAPVAPAAARSRRSAAQAWQGSAVGIGAAAVPARSAGDSVMLVLYGVFAGVALLYTVGWVLVVLAYSRSGAFADPLPALMYQLRLPLAALAPALWGLAVLLLIKPRHRLTRLVWLLLGAVLLVPWPYLGMGA